MADRMERFQCAPGLKLEAHEKMANLHYAQLREQLAKIEEAVGRMERRMWLAVSGLAGTIIAQAVQHLINQG